jgi:glycosyltransferase involved in cell wall biosynthesis
LEEAGLIEETEMPLAIVIPVWRGRFLGAALDSLRAQTESWFRVYICDDASPDDIARIVEEHGTGLDIVYHRFASNLGGQDLVDHWNRSFALTSGEPWLWLFADDDEVMPDTVAAFYREREMRPQARLFCLRLTVIDEFGEVTQHIPDPPEEEDSRSFLHGILSRRGRTVRGADHIFARSLFIECGGFVWTPQALYADIATWVKFTAVAGRKFSLPLGGLLWRKHPASVSEGNWEDSRKVFLEGLMVFAAWVDNFIAEFSPVWRRKIAREMFEFYYDMCWSLPGQGNRTEGQSVFRQLWQLPHVGGKVRALRIAILWIRVGLRRWPLVSIWCNWRVAR